MNVDDLIAPFSIVGFMIKYMEWYLSLSTIDRLTYDFRNLQEQYNELVWKMHANGYLESERESGLVTIP